MVTKNITLSMPEEVVRRAKVLAAERDTSVSALVGELLASLTSPVEDYAEAWQREESLMATGLGLRIGDITWSRDEIHAR